MPRPVKEGKRTIEGVRMSPEDRARFDRIKDHYKLGSRSEAIRYAGRFLYEAIEPDDRSPLERV